MKVISNKHFLQFAFVTLFITFLLIAGCNKQNIEISAEILPISNSEDTVLQIIRKGESYEFSIGSLVAEFPLSYSGDIEAITDLDLDGEPEIVLDITTKGSYCCTIMAVMYFDETTQEYQASNLLIKNWGLSPKMVDADGDDRFEFVTRNNSFTWLSTPTASLSPIQIFRFEDNQIVDVTDEYIFFIEQDAELWLAILNNQVPELDEKYLQLPHVDMEYLISEERLHDEGLKLQVIVPTYLADMELLGRFDEGWSNVEMFCRDENCRDFLNHIRKELLQQ